MKDRWYRDPKTILICAFVIIILVLAIEFLRNAYNFTNLAWFALCVLTAIYAFATIMVVLENRRTIKEMRQARLDAVKPALSLQPGMFTEGGGFHALYLVNSGGVAKGVKIDININNPPSKKALFMTALNKGYMAYLPIGNINELYRTGGLVEIVVTYKDSYNQSLSEPLSFDFSNLKEEGREMIGQESEQYEISRVLEGIERQLRDIERKIK